MFIIVDNMVKAKSKSKVETSIGLEKEKNEPANIVLTKPRVELVTTPYYEVNMQIHYSTGLHLKQIYESARKISIRDTCSRYNVSNVYLHLMSLVLTYIYMLARR